mmetsp:Transcript_30826/g.77384  ORF Transcript_30826/g.77384 Transcript_30826/m.77384 type:complete len:325 (-) Transcript_30826:211-1185(-)
MGGGRGLAHPARPPAHQRVVYRSARMLGNGMVVVCVVARSAGRPTLKHTHDEWSSLPGLSLGRRSVGLSIIHARVGCVVATAWRSSSPQAARGGSGARPGAPAAPDDIVRVRGTMRGSEVLPAAPSSPDRTIRLRTRLHLISYLSGFSAASGTLSHAVYRLVVRPLSKQSMGLMPMTAGSKLSWMPSLITRSMSPWRKPPTEKAWRLERSGDPSWLYGPSRPPGLQGSSGELPSVISSTLSSLARYTYALQSPTLTHTNDHVIYSVARSSSLMHCLRFALASSSSIPPRIVVHPASHTSSTFSMMLSCDTKSPRRRMAIASLVE